tara:strand:- start:6984 stop:7283 length:300 start_codon:yes stop_codon:yes gene_type:complete
MNLGSKPKVPETFDHLIKKVAAEPVKMPEAVKSRTYWSNEELDLLVRLRSLNLTLSECGGHMNRSTNSCGGVVHKYNLYSTIAKKRDELIQAVLDGQVS